MSLIGSFSAKAAAFAYVPEHIRSDNGAEMTAKVVRNWLTQASKATLVNRRHEAVKNSL